MLNQMKQLMEMKKKAEELQRQLTKIKVERGNASNTLKATVNGAQRVESISIDASWFDPQKKDALERSMLEVINGAFDDVQRKAAMETASLMQGLKGLNIPGL